MWYVFPQLPLGTSSMSRKYAIAEGDEARAYLHDDVLHDRLLLITREVHSHLENGTQPTNLMGSVIDCEKLSSSMTLFGHSTIAPTDSDILHISFQVVRLLGQSGFGPCEKTMAILNGGKERVAMPIK